METVGLPFDWGKQQVAAIVARVRNIYVLTLEGHELQEAAAIAAGKAPSSRCSWVEALASFQEQKLQHGSAIKPATWAKTYEPVLTMAVQLLEQPKGPSTAADLLDICLRDWKPGSRTARSGPSRCRSSCATA